VDNTLGVALRLRARGLNVIPVPRPDGVLHDGKKPIVQWRDYQSQPQTEAEVRRLFDDGPSNIAIITGRVSDVVVVDVDSKPAMEFAVIRLPHTPWQTRTNKGYHLFYRHPRVRVPNRARIHTRDGRLEIDVRGDGGYVIAPGSIHASGVAYCEAGDWSKSREELPLFSPGWLARPLLTPKPMYAPKPTGNVIERARRYLAAIPVPEIGAGSDAATLSAACRLVRGFDLAPEDAEALLWEWTGNRPGWTPEWIAEKVQNAERYGTEQVGGLL
jgi:Bifunctional DNA primase/polymerase, N-terminal